MAGPTPRDFYSSTPSVEPTTSAPNDYQTTRANPNQFGAQVGQAVQKLGATGEQVAGQQSDIQLQQQGILNEHLTNQGELDLAVKSGERYNQFKNLEGYDAVNGKSKAIQDILDINNKIRELMNPAAQRGYDMMAARRLSFTIQDMNAYASEQMKKANQNGRVATMNNSIDETSRYENAVDPKQFGYSLGNIKFQAGALFTEPGSGKYQTIPHTVTKDGSLQFENSPQGKSAQADYDNYVNKAVGQAWVNRFEALARDPNNGNPMKASDEYEKDKSQIPAFAQEKINTILGPAVNSAQSRIIADNIVSKLPQSADYLRANYADIIQQARDTATATGKDQSFVDQAAARVEQRVNDVIKGQELQTRVYSDSLLKELNLSRSSSNPITTMDQLEDDPRTRVAWQQLQTNDPYKASGMERIVTANSRGVQMTYGTDVWKHLQGVLSGDVHDAANLSHYVGGDKNSPLTNTGFYRLKDTIDVGNTPEGHTFNQAELKYLQDMQKEYTGSGLLGGSVNSTNPKFNSALQEVLPKIDAARKDGKTMEQIFSPKINGKDNPDYVSSSVKPDSITTLTAPTLAMFKNLLGQNHDVNSLADLQKAVSEGKIKRVDAEKLGIEKGWLRAAPKVPSAF